MKKRSDLRKVKNGDNSVIKPDEIFLFWVDKNNALSRELNCVGVDGRGEDLAYKNLSLETKGSLTRRMIENHKMFNSCENHEFPSKWMDPSRREGICNVFTPELKIYDNVVSHNDLSCSSLHGFEYKNESSLKPPKARKGAVGLFNISYTSNDKRLSVVINSGNWSDKFSIAHPSRNSRALLNYIMDGYGYADSKRGDILHTEGYKKLKERLKKNCPIKVREGVPSFIGELERLNRYRLGRFYIMSGAVLSDQIKWLISEYKDIEEKIIKMLEKYRQIHCGFSKGSWRIKRAAVDISYILTCNGAPPLYACSKKVNPTAKTLNYMKDKDRFESHPVFQKTKIVDLDKVIEYTPDKSLLPGPKIEQAMAIKRVCQTLKKEFQAIDSSNLNVNPRKIKRSEKEAVKNKSMTYSVFSSLSKRVGDDFLKVKSVEEFYPNLVDKSKKEPKVRKESYLEVLESGVSQLELKDRILEATKDKLIAFLPTLKSKSLVPQQNNKESLRDLYNSVRIDSRLRYLNSNLFVAEREYEIVRKKNKKKRAEGEYESKTNRYFKIKGLVEEENKKLDCMSYFNVLDSLDPDLTTDIICAYDTKYIKERIELVRECEGSEGLVRDPYNSSNGKKMIRYKNTRKKRFERKNKRNKIKANKLKHPKETQGEKKSSYFMRKLCILQKKDRNQILFVDPPPRAINQIVALRASEPTRTIRLIINAKNRLKDIFEKESIEVKFSSYYERINEINTERGKTDLR